MHICVTHVDARTGVPCTVAPMSHGPAFPKVKGLSIQWANQSEWPTNYPLFYGTCDDDADTTVPGVVKTLTEQQFLSMRETENLTKALQVRQERDFRLRTQIDTLNPLRWEPMSEAQKEAWKVYRQALLDVPQQEGFPWSVEWPVAP